MDRADEQRAWGDVNIREYKINKLRLKQGHLKYMHVRKEVVRRQHYGKTNMQTKRTNKKPQTCSGKSTHQCTFLKCLHTKACHIENKNEALEVCVQL